jgi:hypothetical protein
MQLCLENFELVVAPAIGEPQHGGKTAAEAAAHGGGCAATAGNAQSRACGRQAVQMLTLAVSLPEGNVATREACKARDDQPARQNPCLNSSSCLKGAGGTKAHERFLSADGKPLRFRVARGALAGNQTLQSALADRRTLILYPGPGATEIESLKVSTCEPRTLIVVDGTWKQASRIVLEPIIQEAVARGSVTCVQFASAGRSQYKFRREPQEQYLSSLESVAYCLRFLERHEQGELAVSHLLRVFGLMVSMQVRLCSSMRPLGKCSPLFQACFMSFMQHARAMHAFGGGPSKEPRVRSLLTMPCLMRRLVS